MTEPNWPPPEWGTPEPGWDIPVNVGRVDSADDVHPDPVVPAPVVPRPIAEPKPRVVRRPSTQRRKPDPRDLRHDWVVPEVRLRGVDSLTQEKIPPPPQVVVIHQSLTHRINELEDSVLRLERRLGQLERRQSIDDIHDGPWDMDPVQ